MSFDEVERVMWADSAETYEAVYAALCVHTIPPLLDAAHVGPGVAVLDVGTGTGNAARAAADRGARVTAVDAEPSMVELARAKVPEADVHLAVLPPLPFPDAAFDAVVGNFVLNHFGRPKVALAELCRVTAPGGRVALTLWPGERSAGRMIFPAAMAATDGWIPMDLPPLDPADDYPRTAEGFDELLREAGLSDVEAKVMDWVHHTTVEQWWSSVANGVAVSGRAYMAQTPEVRAEFHRNYVRIAGEMTDAEGVLRLPQTALLAVGTVDQVGGSSR